MSTASYPPPPPYYRLYKDYLHDPESAPEPPPPIEGTYVCFGSNYTVRNIYLPSFLFSPPCLSVLPSEHRNLISGMNYIGAVHFSLSVLSSYLKWNLVCPEDDRKFVYHVSFWLLLF